MPTYLELGQEPEWRAEFVPPNLQTLVNRLRAHYNLGAVAIGCKGDNRHLRGYHRSRNWIKNSVYCTNRSYSVSETSGNRMGGNGDWLCGLDATLPNADLIAACQRLDVAVRAGRLEKITEWYGNTDGDDRVDGWNNIENRVATSDSSHLWHLHVSFERGRADEDHTDLFEILTGATMPLTTAEIDAVATASAKKVWAFSGAPLPTGKSAAFTLRDTHDAALAADAQTSEPIDVDALAAALAAALAPLIPPVAGAPTLEQITLAVTAVLNRTILAVGA